MSTSIKVSAEISYEVAVGVHWRDELAEIVTDHNKVLILAPAFIAERFELDCIVDSANVFLLVVPEGEAAKTYESAVAAWNYCGEINLGRKDAIFAFGGGTATDFGGFIAATWLRGIKWYAAPSTLAGMVDAAVGGKTGINSPAGKNLVGAFHSPSHVIIDLELLETLSDRDFAAGLAEVIKCGLISDSKILEILESYPTIEGARSKASELIERSVQVKAGVVSQDFQESDLREILNFGHTFGHAVEKLSRYTLRHGEAVAIGTLFALKLSVELSGLAGEVVERVTKLFMSLNLPTDLQDFGQFCRDNSLWPELLGIMQGDKKTRSGELRFITISEIGKPQWVKAPNLDLLEAICASMKP